MYRLLSSTNDEYESGFVGNQCNRDSQLKYDQVAAERGHMYMMIKMRDLFGFVPNSAWYNFLLQGDAPSLMRSKHKTLHFQSNIPTGNTFSASTQTSLVLKHFVRAISRRHFQPPADSPF